MTTLSDVARVAGVSKNTVSRYLNNRGYISDKTAKAIDNAIDVLNYKPNQLARSLHSQRTNLVGLVVPDIAHPFFSTVTSFIEDELDRRGYRMILCNTLHSSDKEKNYIDMLISNKVDGIIIGSHSVDINYSRINAPIVALDRYLAPTIPVVSSDHIQGGLIASQAFIQKGVHRVLQISASSKVKTPSSLRHEVFAKELRIHGIDVVTKELAPNQFEFSTYIKTANEILDSDFNFDGVFSGDSVAVAIQRSALLRGIRVPDDLFIFGYDGTFLSEAVYPSMPTIGQQFDKLSRLTVEVLCKLMNKEPLTDLAYTIPVLKV